MRIFLLLTLSLALGLPLSPSGEPVIAASAYSSCGGVTPPAANAAYEQQVVEMVNAQRWANGKLPPYKRISALDAAARYHSVDMGQDNYFDHNSYNRVSGNLVWVCNWDDRVASYYSGALGENIAAGYANPASVMDVWMNSQGHKENILSSYSWEIGMGFASSGGTYGVYWTQDFARQSGVYPLVINREAASTSSTNVLLYIYGTWTQMRLKNENGAWSAWLPFQNDAAWTLSPGSGTKTVTAELKSGTTVVTSSDIIGLAAVGGNPPSHSLYLPTIFH